MSPNEVMDAMAKDSGYTDYDDALGFIAEHTALVKSTSFVGHTGDGKVVVIVRKGHVARTAVVSSMERRGAVGSVTVNYCTAVGRGLPQTVRTVICGI